MPIRYTTARTAATTASCYSLASRIASRRLPLLLSSSSSSIGRSKQQTRVLSSGLGSSYCRLYPHRHLAPSNSSTKVSNNSNHGPGNNKRIPNNNVYLQKRDYSSRIIICTTTKSIRAGFYPEGDWRRFFGHDNNFATITSSRRGSKNDLRLRLFSSLPGDKKDEQADGTSIPTKNNTKNDNNNNPRTGSIQQHQQQKQEEQNPLFWSNWIHAMKSPPNIITATRMVCSPLLSYWIITGQHELAFVGCVLAGASDWLDGYLAKNYDMATVLGGYLDPAADKLIINVLAVSLWYTSVLPTPLVVLWFGRDFLLFFGAAYYVRSQSSDNTHAFDPTVTPLKVNPTALSKVNTGLQFATLAVGIIHPLYPAIPPEAFTGLCYLTGATTLASGLSYMDLSAFDDSGNDGEGADEKHKAKK